MSIFKTYDIRGVYPQEINEKTFYAIGLRLRSLGIRELAVGRDARLSSQALSHALHSGLLESGITVIDLGVVTSPMLSFYSATKRKKGAMITASHNPREYNGLKFVDERGIQLGYDPFLKKIETCMHTKPQRSPKEGRLLQDDVLGTYTVHFLRKFDIGRELTVIFDCSNGVGGIPLAGILPNFPISSVIIDGKPDGHFPVHNPDQTKPVNLTTLQHYVTRSNADMGVMFDGDADRCAFVDERGAIVPLDLAFLVLALHEISKRKGKSQILFDLRFSRRVYEELTRRGAHARIMRVGNPFYKKVLHKEKNALMAGELSGHIMYKENYGIDDSLYAALKMIELLSQSGKKLSDLIAAHKVYVTSGEISVKVKNMRAIQRTLNDVDTFYRKNREKHIDGISVERADVWFNIRPSNTEPVLRFEIEGRSAAAVEAQKKELLTIIRKHDKN